MKFKLLAVVLLSFFVTVQIDAQQRRPGGGGFGGQQPRFDSAMARLFGKNTAFSSQIVMEMKSESAGMTMPGKLAFLDGKSRFEMDMANAKGPSLQLQAAEQMKAMGMAEIISITRPDKKEQYLVYPGLKSYAAVPSTDTSADSAQKPDDLKKTELGKETINGHPCTKYKVVLKDDTGKEHESTIWSASDLKDFPIKIEMTNEGVPSTITFNDVKFDKPEESLFNPPADFQRYNDPNTMMREAMMKRFAPPGGNAGGTPPGVIPPGGTQPPPSGKAPQQ